MFISGCISMQKSEHGATCKHHQHGLTMMYRPKLPKLPITSPHRPPPAPTGPRRPILSSTNNPVPTHRTPTPRHYPHRPHLHHPHPHHEPRTLLSVSGHTSTTCSRSTMLCTNSRASRMAGRTRRAWSGVNTSNTL